MCHSVRRRMLGSATLQRMLLWPASDSVRRSCCCCLQSQHCNLHFNLPNSALSTPARLFCADGSIYLQGVFEYGAKRDCVLRCGPREGKGTGMRHAASTSTSKLSTVRCAPSVLAAAPTLAAHNQLARLPPECPFRALLLRIEFCCPVGQAGSRQEAAWKHSTTPSHTCSLTVGWQGHTSLAL